MASCTLKPLERGHDVFLAGKKIGQILPSQESNGRFCYVLGCDKSQKPRTYRTKRKATEALVRIHTMVTAAKKERMPLEEVIVQAWGDKPNTSKRWDTPKRYAKKPRKSKAK